MKPSTQNRRWDFRLLHKILKSHDHDLMVGDLEELRSEISEHAGERRARLWYWGQIIRLLPPFAWHIVIWRIIMLRNTIKITLRHIQRQKGYAFINVFGLAVSIACCILMFLWVFDEVSYDRHYPNADRIFRVGYHGLVQGSETKGVQACPPMGPTLARDFPEVVAATRFWRVGFPVLRYQDKVFSEERYFMADSTFFNVFQVSFLAGDPETALDQPNSVVISQSMANKYFGDDDALGKSLNTGVRDIIVTGVVEDVPHNSHFHFDFIVSGVGSRRGTESTWLSNNYLTYFILQDGVSAQAFEAKLKEQEIKYIAPQVAEMFGVSYEQMVESGSFYYHFIQPLTSIHLHSHLEHELEANGDIIYVYIFSLSALGILLLAVVNFVNLSTARSANRAKEVGIRKAVGSTRHHLIRQFLIESILYSTVSAIIALIMVQLILPAFNQFTGKALSIPYSSEPFVIPVIVLFVSIVGFSAGIYPAFFLSAFRPIAVLKSSKLRKPGQLWTRNVLVVVQFIVAIVLIIGSFVVRRQVEYIQTQKLDQADDKILIINKTDDLGRQIDTFKQEIIKHPSVFWASNTSTIIGGRYGDNLYRVAGTPADQMRVIHHTHVDAEYRDVYDLEMVMGSFVPEAFPTDGRRWTLVLNEAAVETFGLENPVGTELVVGDRQHTITGVVKNYHYRSIHHTIAPLIINVIGNEAFGGRTISLRVSSENIQQTVQFLEKTWRQFTGNQAFEYEFFDNYYDSLYRAELRTGSVFFTFSIFALFIAGLGLFGLSAFIAEQRTKEIGIRRVLGASVSGIVIMLTKQFAKWVLIATVIAWPLAYYTMSLWLRNFVYRQSMNFWMFVLSSILALAMAILTVYYQSVKAARLDPVESLRYE